MPALMRKFKNLVNRQTSVEVTSTESADFLMHELRALEYKLNAARLSMWAAKEQTQGMLETFGELLGASVPLLCEDGPDGVRAKPLPPGNKDTIGGEYNSKGLQEARHLADQLEQEVLEQLDAWEHAFHGYAADIKVLHTTREALDRRREKVVRLTMEVATLQDKATSGGGKHAAALQEAKSALKQKQTLVEETLASFQEKDAALRAQMEELIRNSSRLKMLMGTFLHQHIGVLQAALVAMFSVPSSAPPVAAAAEEAPAAGHGQAPEEGPADWQPPRMDAEGVLHMSARDVAREDKARLHRISPSPAAVRETVSMSGSDVSSSTDVSGVLHVSASPMSTEDTAPLLSHRISPSCADQQPQHKEEATVKSSAKPAVKPTVEHDVMADFM